MLDADPRRAGGERAPAKRRMLSRGASRPARYSSLAFTLSAAGLTLSLAGLLFSLAALALSAAALAVTALTLALARAAGTEASRNLPRVCAAPPQPPSKVRVGP